MPEPEVQKRRRVVSDVPPPEPWWPSGVARVVCLISMLAGAAAVVLRAANGVAEIHLDTLVLVTHGVAAGALLSWAVGAMHNARNLAPDTLYRTPSRSWIAAVLLAPALLACWGAVVGWDWVRNESDVEFWSWNVLAPVAIGAIAVWAPFHYLRGQAVRVGTPARDLLGWLGAPLLVAGGGQLIFTLGLGDELEVGGITDTDRALELALTYAAPMLVFALTTWRATTAIDATLKIRWTRKAGEWRTAQQAAQYSQS